MREIRILPARALGYEFIPEKYLPQGVDENYLRNAQVGRPPDSWRHLRSAEIETLVKNGVTCGDWDSLLVTDPFTPHLIKNCEFSGLVRLGRLQNVVLEHHELKTSAGITNSLIISCDVGDNCAIHNVRHLAHFILGDNVVLLNIDEMNTTNHAKFGNGILKEGESEDTRVWLDLMNESGGRAVMPFDGMIPADAYLWAKYRDDQRLVQRLGEMTQEQFDARRGFFGQVGKATVIKNSRILKDVKIGSRCYIKGANKLKNLTINSSDEEPTQIGEGVEMVNGIVGLGCRVFYGCKAVRFIMGNNTSLKYGARLLHSMLGDNSTVSCCELLNNLIFPAHEQHHNNSFLTSSLLMGQSNIAAGATIGSNHNSRANDGEIQAGRGFWPGLCTTLKHSCRFASFVLLVKGDYPAELDVPLPFALLRDDPAGGRLVVMPAYWWLHNMYALARNTWKYQARDKRKTKTQHVEFDCLAPDTAEEMIAAMRLLEIATAKAQLRQEGASTDSVSDDALAVKGRELLTGPAERTAELEILGENMENARRKTVLVQVRRGYRAYREMLHAYAMKNLLEYLRQRPEATVAAMAKDLSGPRERRWVNLGGQLVEESEVDRLRADIGGGTIADWPEVHQAYDRLWKAYPKSKQRHALACLLLLCGADALGPKQWEDALVEMLRIQEYIRDEVYRTRKKDYDNPFRQATFRNAEEMRSTIGTAEDNDFVRQVREETEHLARRIAAMRK
jgi:hypothetical protein